MLHAMTIRVLASAFALFGPVLGVYAAVPPTNPAAPTVSKPQIAATMMGMPLQFEANHGQVDAQVKFLSRGSGYTLFLTPTESVMVLQQREATSQPSGGHDPLATTEPAPIKQSVVRMKLEGANPSPAIDGMEQLPGIVNYFIGNDPAKWRTKIPTYAKVHYTEAYPGIDLAYYGNQGKLEYDFIVAPGADPNQIKLAFEGASEVRISESGDLVLQTLLGEVRLQKPIVYQIDTDGHKKLVAGRYLADREKVSASIQVAAYDTGVPLIIDPVLVYSSFIGSVGVDSATDIAVDSNGNAFVVGFVQSSLSFPLAGTPYDSSYNGSVDIFLLKVSTSGSLLSSTYLGSPNSDHTPAIALDGFGNPWITGTANVGFPTTPGSIQPTIGGSVDGFVAKLDANASSLLYSTFYGGSNVDNAFSIAVDAAGTVVYIAGETVSTNLPGVSSDVVQPSYGGGTSAQER